LIFFVPAIVAFSLAFSSQPIEQEADSWELKADLDFFDFA